MNTAPQREQIFFEEQAGSLAAHLPDLMVEAERIAMTVTHGLHGRRRRGPGETFWQYRSYEQSDTASMIDWRRSAGTDHLYVREREWEAAHYRLACTEPDRQHEVPFQALPHRQAQPHDCPAACPVPPAGARRRTQLAYQR